MTAFDVSLLDDVQRQMQELENRINSCGIMHPETRPSSQQTTASASKKHVLSPTSARGKEKYHAPCNIHTLIGRSSLSSL